MATAHAQLLTHSHLHGQLCRPPHSQPHSHMHNQPHNQPPSHEHGHTHSHTHSYVADCTAKHAAGSTANRYAPPPNHTQPQVISLPTANEVAAGTARTANMRPYGCAVDIWAVGVLVYELLAGRPPVEHRCPEVMALLVQAGMREPLPSGASSECADFVAAALRGDAAARPSAAQLLAHPWVQKHCWGGVAFVPSVVQGQQQQHIYNHCRQQGAMQLQAGPSCRAMPLKAAAAMQSSPFPSSSANRFHATGSSVPLPVPSSMPISAAGPPLAPQPGDLVLPAPALMAMSAGIAAQHAQSGAARYINTALAARAAAAGSAPLPSPPADEALSNAAAGGAAPGSGAGAGSRLKQHSFNCQPLPVQSTHTRYPSRLAGTNPPSRAPAGSAMRKQRRQRRSSLPLTAMHPYLLLLQSPQPRGQQSSEGSVARGMQSTDSGVRMDRSCISGALRFGSSSEQYSTAAAPNDSSQLSQGPSSLAGGASLCGDGARVTGQHGAGAGDDYGHYTNPASCRLESTCDCRCGTTISGSSSKSSGSSRLGGAAVGGGGGQPYGQLMLLDRLSDLGVEVSALSGSEAAASPGMTLPRLTSVALEEGGSTHSQKQLATNLAPTAGELCGTRDQPLEGAPCARFGVAAGFGDVGGALGAEASSSGAREEASSPWRAADAAAGAVAPTATPQYPAAGHAVPKGHRAMLRQLLSCFSRPVVAAA